MCIQFAIFNSIQVFNVRIMMVIKISFFLVLKCFLLAQNILCHEVRVDASSAKAQLVKLDPPGKQSF